MIPHEDWIKLTAQERKAIIDENAAIRAKRKGDDGKGKDPKKSKTANVLSVRTKRDDAGHSDSRSARPQ